MDPWSSCHSLVLISKNDILTKFEDNFVVQRGDKLPDHEKYLAALESKLKKIKSDPNVLSQLASKKEACMRQLLSEETTPDLVQISLDKPISDSALLRTLLPERQALNQGEVVEFIKYDQLLIENPTGDNPSIGQEDKTASETLRIGKP